MKNVLILGSGRSGTSMVAGVLAKAGYFLGEKLYPPDEGNPKGYFEDAEINAINEELLQQVAPAQRTGIWDRVLRRQRPAFGHRWLIELPVGVPMACPAHLADQIQQLTRRQPFCFKDPRFSYTLPAWRPYVEGAVRLVVFRHPAVTANSILAQCRREAYLRGLSMDYARALRVWEAMHAHILDEHRFDGGTWVFAHYQQFLNGSVFSRLQEILEVGLDSSFIDSSLSRSDARQPASESALSLYRRLCDLAGFGDGS